MGTYGMYYTYQPLNNHLAKLSKNYQYIIFVHDDETRVYNKPLSYDEYHKKSLENDRIINAIFPKTDYEIQLEQEIIQGYSESTKEMNQMERDSREQNRHLDDCQNSYTNYMWWRNQVFQMQCEKISGKIPDQSQLKN